jgi:hypothetical protein
MEAEMRQPTTATKGHSRLPNRILWYILIVTLCWFLATFIPFWLDPAPVGFDLRYDVLAGLFSGLLAGLVFWLFLRRMLPHLGWKRGLIIIVGWTLALLFLRSFNLEPNPTNAMLIFAFSGVSGGVFGGGVMGWVFRQVVPSWSKKQFWWLVLGCALGFGIGGVIGLISEPVLNSYSWNDPRYGTVIALSLGSAVAGLLVASAVVHQLASPSGRMIRWEVVLFGAAGFFLGKLVANLIFGYQLSRYGDLITVYLYLAMIGAIGGAFLGLPSRQPMRILFLSALGLLGLPLGLWLSEIRLIPLNIIYLWGAGIGLTLGLSTRSLPGTLILALVGMVATAISQGIVPLMQDSLLDAMMWGVTGGILAFGWSFLGADVTRDQTAQ